MSFTSDDLITAIKKRGLIPTAQKTYLKPDFLRFADEEMRVFIVTKILSVRENYFQKSAYEALVDGQNSYDIPSRAVASKLKNLFYIDSSGEESEIDFIEPDEACEYQSLATGGQPLKFYFESEKIVLVPTPSGSAVGNQIRMSYFMRRPNLIQPSDAGTVLSVNTGLKQITINATPSAFSTLKLFDLIQATPQFKHYAIDQEITDITNDVITFADALPAGIVAGDYVALADQSPIVHLPVEILPVLAQRVSVRCLRGMGNQKGADSAEVDLREMEASVLGLISTRVEDQPKKIRSRNNIGNHVFGNRW